MTESAQALHVSPAAIALVATGGAVGTAARFLLTRTVMLPSGFPLAVLLINTVGAFLLGLLLEALARHGSDEGGRRRLRLLLGTGFLGGFTTYSTFAFDSVALLREDRIAETLLYGAATVLIGTLAAALGIALARRLRGRSA